MFDKFQGLQAQRDYADKRKRAINQSDQVKTDLVIAAIKRLAEENNVSLERVARLSGTSKEGWEIVYDVITRRLQTAQLTINLSAESWFSGENTYKTYATTYQKNVVKTDQGKVLKTQYKPDNTESEGANARLAADEKVTLPQEWANAGRFTQRRRLFDAMSTGNTDINALTKVDFAGGKEGYRIDNRKFNAHAKQVFAALNYGKRPSGSNFGYGYSYIVLRPELKRKAIYFPGDTFAVASGRGSATAKQCSFETLGAILANAPADMEKDIWTSCYLGHTAADTDDPYRLLEAHIFEKVRMDKDVESLHLSRSTKDGDLSAVEWENILQNARVWARKNNVRFLQ